MTIASFCGNPFVTSFDPWGRARPKPEPKTDPDYRYFLTGVGGQFRKALAEGENKLFTTDVDPEALWLAYLSKAPASDRQQRTCNACRSFIQRFGGLVTIDAKTGGLTSAMWPSIDQPGYNLSLKAMHALIKKANVSGVFLTSEPVLGSPFTGAYTHISAPVPPAIRYTGKLLTAEQVAAEKLEDFKMLNRALSEFGILTARQAKGLLQTETLYRSEKVFGVAAWFLELHEAILTTKNAKHAKNIIWRAVATAPPGYCHIRSSMIGTLLEDLAAGLPLQDVKRKFAEKMNPTQYMRPTAAPTAGNIAQAEKIVADLHAQGSLLRRFARTVDIEKVWSLKPIPIATLPRSHFGVFGHLAKSTSARAPMDALQRDPIPMTWVKFWATVLPNAQEVEYLVPRTAGAYTAMVTAVRPKAPNLLQWDNPVSHYVYVNGSAPQQWNLTGGSFTRVTAVSLRSWMWGGAAAEGKYAHHGAGVVFCLQGCRDTAHVKSGGMFPEQMKAEYHGVRKTLEAYFQNAPIQDNVGTDFACGVALTKGALGGWDQTFRVTSNGVRTLYKLDRWD